MKYARLLSKLYAEPVMLSMPAWSAFDGALSALMSGAQLPNLAQAIHGGDRAALVGPDRGPEYAQARTRRMYEQRGDVALIYCAGVIDKHVSLADLDCYGGVDLDDLDAALMKAAMDKGVRKIMLVGDSPGGSVVGVHETAMLFAEIGKKKDTAHYSDSLTASAMYYIASQAHQIYTTYSASYGSIGVYCAMLDETEALANEGVKVNLIKAGKFKAMGAPFKKLTSEERAILQERTNRIYDMFVETVQSARPQVSLETCQGQCFFGEQNIEAGLADVLVRSLDEALLSF